MSVLRPAARQLRREVRNYSASSSGTTPAAASSYLSTVLELPESAAFPPQLALQLLTHKSYRFVHRLTNMSEEELVQSQVSHNARFAFIGRRALASYLAMFLHAQGGTSEGVRSLELLGKKDIATKLEDMMSEYSIGRNVGHRWGVQDVMRWTPNPNAIESKHAAVKGHTVAAIMGGVFQHLGSPAAQRAFHIHVLPQLAHQLRDPVLMEAVQKLAVSAGKIGVVAKQAA